MTFKPMAYIEKENKRLPLACQLIPCWCQVGMRDLQLYHCCIQTTGGLQKEHQSWKEKV